MRILFAGTPQVAVPSLEAVAEHFDVVAALTRPDAVRGRGRKTEPSPVKVAAQRLGIPVLEMSPKDPTFLEKVAELGVEAAAVVAYGRILTQKVLDAVPMGWYNLHFSELPAWRGAAPVQRAIWNGDDTTGLTVFKITAGMDSGPIVLQRRVPIEGRPTSGELLESLAHEGPELLVKALEKVGAGTAQFRPQPDFADADHAYAKKITPLDARADFSLPAEILDRRIRACNPDPGAWCEVHAEAEHSGADDADSVRDISAAHGTDSAQHAPQKMRLNAVTPVSVHAAALDSVLELQGIDVTELRPGALIVSKKHVWVLCGGDTFLELNNVTAQGKKPMPAADWARGARLDEDAYLG
ncbi:MAG: methionyl-tRNA formyltransferase [Bifidobacteriaceae bacterium]|jgi:methionyl-tRNA formyltransferase|nr:methionyl-tRNA formyltransferase [Bifidobacteriaceae bacterium]